MNEAVTPYWWIDHISTILSTPLAIAGFGIAFWQIAKTKKAAIAAKEAAEAAIGRVQALTIAGLLPQLTRIDDEIDRAVQEKSFEMLRFWISQWKWQAGVTRGYLDSSKREEDKVMRLIQSSIVAATDARRGLHTIEPQNLINSTADLRKSIGRVTSELGMLAAMQSSATEGASNA